MRRFTDMFHASPFAPLLEHMTKVMECVGLVRPLFEAVRFDKRETLEGLTKQIFKAEHEADLIKDEIRQTIPRTFYLPVFRGDLLGHLKSQDDMADEVEDLAVLVTLKHLALPESLGEQTMKYVDTVVQVCDLAHALAKEFRDVLQGGLDPDRVAKTLEDVKAVEKAEWEADRCQYRLSQALYALEGQISPIDIMLWSKVFGELGCLANAAEDIADRVRRMLTAR